MKEPQRSLPPPTTEDEFDRVLKALNRVVIKRLRPHWKAILNAYWHGGLRLAEPMDFRWHGAGFHVPVLDHCDYPYVDWAPRQKHKKHQTVAITDEFAEVLRGLPRINEFVFQVGGPKVRYTGRHQLSDVIRQVAESEKVARETERGQVTATAQHLRRSFGQRMSQQVGAATLRYLMRHALIATTMKYYVADDARMAAMDLRQEMKQNAS